MKLSHRNAFRDWHRKEQRMAPHAPTLKQRLSTLWQRLVTSYRRLTAPKQVPPWERDTTVQLVLMIPALCLVLILTYFLWNVTSPGGVAAWTSIFSGGGR